MINQTDFFHDANQLMQDSKVESGVTKTETNGRQN